MPQCIGEGCSDYPGCVLAILRNTMDIEKFRRTALGRKIIADLEEIGLDAPANRFDMRAEK